MIRYAEKQKVVCDHCGDECGSDALTSLDKHFCCDGCKMVYELLAENNLCTYYNLDEKPGISPKILEFNGKYAYLDDTAVVDKLLRFQNDTEAHVIFNLPQIHCSSCVWLLEHLYRLDKGIMRSRTDFLKKEISIEYDKSQTSLRKVVELLATIGYTPQLQFEDLENRKEVKPQRQRVYRIAVAGFCFANIMMLSFPEYFHIASTGDSGMQHMFNYLNLMLSLPVLIYSGGEFYVSAWQGFKAKYLNIDAPLALSIFITFGRSLFEILTDTGSGYLDSMSGIIFFMLIGRYFQERTYFNLQFDRNYKSYFPISVSIIKNGEETSIPLSTIAIGDRIKVRSQELIPADARLQSINAFIDYSFVTGESRPVRVQKGELIYAGGRNVSGSVELIVEREVQQSYLTNLWNKDAFKEQQDAEQKSFIHKMARNFTIFLLALSVGSFLYWLPTDMHRGLNALTTVLIVACPCALLLSVTFTNGAALRIFSKNKFYLKNSLVIEKLGRLTSVVFDKTGTITQSVTKEIHFEGSELNEQQLGWIYSVVHESNHPLSKAIAEKLSFCDASSIQAYSEISGAGISGKVDGHFLKVGSASYVHSSTQTPSSETRVYVSVDGEVLGYFKFLNTYRDSLNDVISSLKKRFKLSVLSGDNDGEKAALAGIFGAETPALFFQKPEDKLHYIEQLQGKKERVAMVGDGLNDAGALKQSDVGIAVSENVNNFSPACDAILESSSFPLLERLIAFARAAHTIIMISFVISLMYNVVGLSFAVQGELAPVVAAILMPISSISIVLFTTGASQFYSRKLGLR